VNPALERLLGRGRHEVDLARLELGAERRDLVLVEVVLEGERLEGLLLDRAALLGLVEKLTNEFGRAGQFLGSFLAGFVGGLRC
jgi:hypothetical protein